MFRPIMTAPAPMQAPNTVLGLNLIESSSASKYLIRPADDWRPLPSFFFLAIFLLLSYHHLKKIAVSIVFDLEKWRGSNLCRLPAAHILERITVFHTSAFDRSRPIVAGITPG